AARAGRRLGRDRVFRARPGGDRPGPRQAPALLRGARRLGARALARLAPHLHPRSSRGAAELREAGLRAVQDRDVRGELPSVNFTLSRAAMLILAAVLIVP